MVCAEQLLYFSCPPIALEQLFLSKEAIPRLSLYLGIVPGWGNVSLRSRVADALGVSGGECSSLWSAQDSYFIRQRLKSGTIPGSGGSSSASSQEARRELPARNSARSRGGLSGLFP